MGSFPFARDAFTGTVELSADAGDVMVPQMSSNKTRANFGEERLKNLDKLKSDLVISYTLRLEAQNVIIISLLCIKYLLWIRLFSFISTRRDTP